MTHDIDVAVIGGGISGLAVAKGLIDRGIEVQLFEARNRLGGRIETVADATGAADLGPTWFWRGEHRVTKLVERFELEVFDQWTTGDALFMSNGATQVQRGRYQLPHSYRLTAGLAAVVNGLANELPPEVIQLGQPVVSVAPQPEDLGVSVQLADATISAGAAVIALPPSLALSGGLVARADLDAAVAEVAADVAVWMGGITKAVARYERPFWREAGLSGFASAMAGPFNEIHDMSGPDGDPAQLFGFGRSPNKPESLTTATFVDQLTTLFGPDAAHPVDVFLRDWRAEPLTTPGSTLSQRFDLFGAAPLREPTWKNRLYWSSTETATEAPGHIEGALAAAERTISQLSASDRF